MIEYVKIFIAMTMMTIIGILRKHSGKLLRIVDMLLFMCHVTVSIYSFAELFKGESLWYIGSAVGFGFIAIFDMFKSATLDYAISQAHVLELINKNLTDGNRQLAKEVDEWIIRYEEAVRVEKDNNNA